MADDKHFNANKVFAWLFVLTAGEVAYGMAFHVMNKLFLWGGLGIFAFFKGWLIAVYFMHLKFEGWVVKSLILPTPLLILVIWGYASPDVANSKVIDHPIGSMYDAGTGKVEHDMGRHDGKKHGVEDAAANEH